MQKLILALLTVCLTSAVYAQADGNEAVRYFDFFNQAHAAISQRNMDYLQHAVHTDDDRVVAAKRTAVVEQIAAAKQQIGSLPPYSGDAGLKAAMEKVLANYDNLLNTTLPEVEILKEGAKESFLKMEAYLKAQDAAEKSMARSAEEFILAQRKYAKANSIELIEAEENSEIDQINAVNAYYRQLYLIQFKFTKPNAEFLDGLYQEDAEAMKAARVNLLKTCRAELPRLRAIGDFKGNTAYRDAIIEQAEWLEQVAQKEYLDLLRGTDKATELTNEIVDSYNAAAGRVSAEYGASVDKANAAAQQLMRDNVPKPSTRGVKQL